MGALKGSMSVRRYAVTEALPADARKKLIRGLRAHTFAELDPKGDVDQSVGWVSLLDSDDTELEAGNCLFVASGGEQLRVSMRVDVLKAPASEVRRKLESKVRLVEGEQGRKISRRERRELKEEIVHTLRQRISPRVRTFDVAWNLDTGRLYFWSQTKGMNELFLDLFVKSFALRVELEGPTMWARAAVDLPTLAKIEPTDELWKGFEGVRPLSSGMVEDL